VPQAFVETLFKDIRYAIRGLRKRPGFTFVAVITLALGIGANTAIFSVVNAVLLKPLAFKDPDRLVIVWEDAAFVGFPRNTPAPANYFDWKSQNRSFEDMAATAPTSFNLTGDGDPERVAAHQVSENFFPLLGVQPLLGRTFLQEEDREGGNKVVLLSYQLWQTRYGGAADIVNRNIQMNGEKYTVVGVMPAGFQFLDKEVRVWVPLALDKEEQANRGGHYLSVVARLKPDIGVAQAQADMSALMANMAHDHPNEMFDGKLGAVVLPLREQLVGDSRKPLLVLLVAVAFVLLIACANVAGLLLARAVSRRREIALRVALGASSLRVVRQLLTESLLLATAGGALGAILAWWSFGFLQKLVPEALSVSTSLHLDIKVLLFAFLISLTTGVVFGLVPALQSAKVDLNETLKQSSSRATSTGRLRSSMIVFEVALSIVLLVGAGLLIQTLFHLFNQYSEMQPDKILTMRTVLPRMTKYKEPAKRAAFYEQVLERVEHLPGVVAAGYTTSVPLAWKGGTTGIYPEGLKDPIPGMAFDACHRQVSSDYLQTMKIPLRQGRYLTRQDNQQSLPVAVINETMARQYWPGQSALGRRFKLGDPNEDIPWVEIVGIVGDVRQMGLDEAVKAEMYLPYQQVKQPWFIPRDLAIRTTGESSRLVGAVRQAIRDVDPDQPISNVATMSELLGEEAGQRRLGMIMLAAFSVLALLLASIGIYGVLAYFVTQHTNEIGVRLALGATPRNILLMIVKRGMGLTLLGISIGLAASFALTRLMTSLLFEVKAVDPLTFLFVPLLLAVAALLACSIPARRAMKVDPLVALRYE